MNALERASIAKAGRDHGWECVLRNGEHGVILGSSRHDGEATIEASTPAGAWSCLFNNGLAMAELRRSFPDAARADGTFVLGAMGALTVLLRRAAELHMSLPNAAARRYAKCVKEGEHVEGTNDLAFSQVGDVAEAVRRKTLVFDWLVQNEDRILGERGGNVNVLWVAGENSVFVIDHNLAFDTAFNVASWKAQHVFRNDLDAWDAGFALALEPLLKDTQLRLDEYWGELPDEWVDVASLLPEFSLARLHAVLARFAGANSLFGMVTK